MTEIILVRHGETGWNVSQTYRGRADVALDEVGIKQAELLGSYPGDWKLEAIYSSPLRRARDTANAIARHHNIRGQVASGLIDLDYGSWQGLPEAEAHVALSELW